MYSFEEGKKEPIFLLSKLLINFLISQENQFVILSVQINDRFPHKTSAIKHGFATPRHTQHRSHVIIIITLLPPSCPMRSESDHHWLDYEHNIFLSIRNYMTLVGIWCANCKLTGVDHHHHHYQGYKKHTIHKVNQQRFSCIHFWFARSSQASTYVSTDQSFHFRNHKTISSYTQVNKKDANGKHQTMRCKNGPFFINSYCHCTNVHFSTIPPPHQ